MKKLGFYFEQSKCVGCRTCQVACKDVKELPIGTIYRYIRDFEQGSYPTPGYYHYSWSCNHCESPACVANCPTGAMHVTDDGTISPNDELCIGCETCSEVCPYHVPVLRMEKGIIGKCDSCKSLRDQGERPVCVDACVMRCLDFGDLDELKSKYGEGLVQELPILPSASITNPSILIKPRDAALKTDYNEVRI